MAKRGEFTEAVKRKMEAFLGRESSRIELRLLPYVLYQMVNEQRIDPAKINQEERAVLSLWRESGYIEGGASGLAMTKEFWDFGQEIVWLSYVAYREQETVDA